MTMRDYMQSTLHTFFFNTQTSTARRPRNQTYTKPNKKFKDKKINKNKLGNLVQQNDIKQNIKFYVSI